MSRILKIEDTKTVTENDRKITRYVFNDDKVVRVDARTDEVITRNVPQVYLDLISVHSAKTKTQKEETEKRSIRKKEDEIIEKIKSGSGAGLGVLLGMLLKFTIIGPIIAGFASFDFLDMISDKDTLVDYIEKHGVRRLNFKKGFYASAFFGWLVAWGCCDQWKRDMVSVLLDDPTKPSQNRHLCYKVWFCLDLVVYAFSFVSGFIQGYNSNSTTNYRTSTYYYNKY